MGCLSSPARMASHSNHSPNAVATTIAINDASSPKPLPVRSGGPVSCASTRPWTLVPDTGMSKISPWVKFYAACIPIGSHKLRVSM
jgi:hypothetical protein